ncbi:MAG TPA: CRISPR-associated protein Cas4, partial [Candidatus Hydrogenedentes bacterium]|nr:CRISPR-associated protein Cas4 [Candidatus Hydrogenedentota bacterium]
MIDKEPDLTPVRMLNEYAYCPRLCWIEWVDGEFADSVDTLGGTFQHRRVDKEGGDLSEPANADADEEASGEQAATPVDDPVLSQARSVMMSAPGVGLIARLDLVEEQGGRAVPVDVKRGSAPDIPEGAYEPERVQVCAQGLILRENGYTCDHAEIYFAQSRRRVTIPLDDALVARTLDLLAQMRAMAASGQRPPPLDASPKCPRCSLASICLPDETNVLLTGDAPAEEDQVRRLTPARDDALPLYIQKHGAVLGKRGEQLVVTVRGETLQQARLIETSQVCVFGGAQLTTPAIQECLARNIPVLFFSFGGWFYGMTHGLGHKNIGLRQAQYRA